MAAVMGGIAVSNSGSGDDASMRLVPGSSAPDTTGRSSNASSAIDTDGLVAPDPNFSTALARAGISSRGWETDFSRHTVPFGELFSGGPPKDGIPPIDKPKFISPDEASDWLDGREPVLFFEANGDARAYPLQILTLARDRQ